MIRMEVRGVRKNPGVLAVALIVLLGLLATSCGGGKQVQEPTQSPGATAWIEAQALVQGAMASTTFEPPGPAFDASRARGKTVMVIGVTEAVPFVKELDDLIQEALEKAGVHVLRGDGKASPTEFARLMDQAIVRKASVILLVAVNPQAVTEPIRRAAAAGVKVITMIEADPTAPLPENVFGRVSFSYSQIGQLLAAWTAVDSRGNANSVVFTSTDAPSHPFYVKGFQDGYQQFCPGCKLKMIDVHVPDWQTRLAPAVQSALTADPSITHVLPFYDGMTFSLVPAIHEAGAADKVALGTLDATPAVMELLRRRDVVKMEIGESNPWLAWAAADQALRALAGEPPLQDEKVPFRLFTNENFDQLSDNPLDWYGPPEAFMDGYRALWGLSEEP
jgi:ribose transport system substrate-binding protein